MLNSSVSRSSLDTQGLLTEDQYFIIMEFCCTMWMLLSILGIVGNLINIKTFLAIGFEDVFTVSFLALSISDFSFVVLNFANAFAMAFYIVELETNFNIWYSVEPFGVTILAANYGNIIYVFTELLTTFLAVARCLCVAKPFHFKNFFTIQLSLLFHLAFSIFTVSINSPALTNISLTEQFDMRINRTRIVLWVSPNREIIKDIIWGIRDIFLPITTQLIVVASVIVMANCLISSSKFRNNSSTPGGIKQAVSQNKIKERGKRSRFHKTQTDRFKNVDSCLSPVRNVEPHDVSGSSKLTGKELQVVQQVILISLVYIVCNTPKILVSVTNIVVADFTMGRRYHYIYLASLSLDRIFTICNSSLNTFIYFKFNSRFRAKWNK